MLPSSIQNAHSAAGTMISALGNASASSALRKPPMWSPWKCEITIRSIAFGSTPAAARPAGSCPVVGARLEALPASSSTSFDPVFTSTGLNWFQYLSVGRYAACSAALMSSSGLLRTIAGWTVNLHRAVGDHGDFQVPDLGAVVARRLLAGRRRGGERDVAGRAPLRRRPPTRCGVSVASSAAPSEHGLPIGRVEFVAAALLAR